MLQKREEKTADSLILNQSTNLRFKISHIVCHSEIEDSTKLKSLHKVCVRCFQHDKIVGEFIPPN
ncbi:hypothetical protein FLCU109888_01110 [Flavobacterium cucumis]|uniref:Uncharacterized protein n=1 Tax=Flavobacterium cucumis TaxID=416016 RepID=A0A1M7ZTH6_9FLAO|nr:hypothetical protein SAMN05443547_0546 [Flavobacterium cucumis]